MDEVIDTDLAFLADAPAAGDAGTHGVHVRMDVAVHGMVSQYFLLNL
jgi:hypothetical protein